MPDSVSLFRLSNGLEVVVESMPDVQSAALTLMIPAGGVHDPAGRCGTAAILAEMLPRGAGGMSARELSAALDNLGLQRNVQAGAAHQTISAATTADRLAEALPLIARMVREPHLEAADFDAARDLVEQGLLAMEDEPRQRLGRVLRRHSYAAPWGNPPEGYLSDLPQISIHDVRALQQRCLRPGGAILGIAGNVDPVRIRDAAEAAFAGWTGTAPSEPAGGERPESLHHTTQESAQTHIGLAWDSVPYCHDRYYEAWAVVSLLSGGMSSRLFTEVREKRGLCYAISASLSTLREEARVFVYAGTTGERAQETLDVTVAEVRKLADGISAAELDRCRARAKSALIMQQESTGGRAGSLARDLYYLGRVVSFDEINRRIDGLTPEQVRQFALDYPPRSIVMVTIGPQPLDAACLTGG
jgi:predicted Zn-dependent peptidase